MNFIHPEQRTFFRKSNSTMWVNIEKENLPVNLNLVISYKKVDISMQGSSEKINCIRFITTKDDIIWYFDTIEERDFEFTKLENKYFK